jgi:mannose-6-phosphate isomerase-like protein (cupin superfamily)
MKHLSTTRHKKLFTPLLQSTTVQAASMVLQPGQSSGEKVEDEHPHSEQWLFVVSGTGRAKFKKRSIPIKAGSLLLIERREPHLIVNSGDEPLVTINFYAPPAYTADGNVKRNQRTPP